jgi:NADPH:quinone reductase-like Zn-dependent oxidoreductase
VIGVDRETSAYVGHSQSPIRMFNSTTPELGRMLLDAAGRGADIAFNTVGSPYFAAALESLAVGGTQVLISTIERTVPFDILPFYRRNLQMLGVDSLKLSADHCAPILDGLRQSFDEGQLKAFEVNNLIPFERAADAYRTVIAGSTERVVLAP